MPQDKNSRYTWSRNLRNKDKTSLTNSYAEMIEEATEQATREESMADVARRGRQAFFSRFGKCGGGKIARGSARRRGRRTSVFPPLLSSWDSGRRLGVNIHARDRTAADVTRCVSPILRAEPRSAHDVTVRSR
jgi:hypothetical protein